MDIALLNVKIVIEKNAVVVDEIGNRKIAWISYYSCLPQWVVKEEKKLRLQASRLMIQISVFPFDIVKRPLL